MNNKIEENKLEILFNQIKDQLLLLRNNLVSKYGEDNLYGKCIEASDEVLLILKNFNIKAKSVEGWCVYDDASSCSNDPYDAHTWVEAIINDKTYMFDVTLTQFSFFISIF